MIYVYIYMFCLVFRKVEYSLLSKYSSFLDFRMHFLNYREKKNVCYKLIL